MSAPLHRIVDGALCAHRACTAPSRALGPEDACVRVSTPKGAKRLSKAAKQASAVLWDAGAPATHFHEGCWAVVAADAADRLVAAVAEGHEAFEAVGSVRAKAREVAELLRRSKHTAAFTGAGISVAAGIPDYRGVAGVDVVR